MILFGTKNIYSMWKLINLLINTSCPIESQQLSNVYRNCLWLPMNDIAKISLCLFRDPLFNVTIKRQQTKPSTNQNRPPIRKPPDPNKLICRKYWSCKKGLRSLPMKVSPSDRKKKVLYPIQKRYILINVQEITMISLALWPRDSNEKHVKV